MSFKTRYPDFALIEKQIIAARAERAVVIATGLADAIMWVTRFVQRLAGIEGTPPMRDPKGKLVVKAQVGKAARA